MAVRVGILGATGYTALESLRLLVGHPKVEITAVTSRQDEGLPIASVHPELQGRLNLPLMLPDVSALAEKADLVFCCLPHGASAATVKELRSAGLKVIDFSADFRLSKIDEYESWYGVEHPWPEQVGHVVYGLPELFADQLYDADLVANPGCYPTSAILPLAPLIAADAIEPTDIIVDSKSGVSGAGRSPKLGTLYCEVNESISAYSIARHRHQPEICDIVDRVTGTRPTVLFTPHLTPMHRGILSTIYVKARGSKAADIRDIWRQSYVNDPFLRVVEHLPATKHVSGTNYVDMHVAEAGERLVLVTVIDNLVKGAAGAAVQSMNCIYAWDQRIGLDTSFV